MIVSTPRRVFVACACASALVPFWLAAACGGPAKPPSTATPSASASASVPLFTQSSGASPIDLTFKAGACEVEARDGLGATYKFEGPPEAVSSVLQGALTTCLAAPKGTQGTVYVEAKVGQGGALADVVVSPGGAISTDVVQCLTGSFGQAKLPPPKQADSILLLFVISACPPP